MIILSNILYDFKVIMNVTVMNILIRIELMIKYMTMNEMLMKVMENRMNVESVIITAKVTRII